MRDSVSTGRHRKLVLLALLTLLFTALTSAYSDAVPPAPTTCSAAGASATEPVDRTCAPEADVRVQAESDTRHPGNGFRRLRHTTACHLRPQAPTGPNGKAVRETSVAVSAATSGPAVPWAVLPVVDAGTAVRVTVLRC
ncbi:hypothetical protein [Streptomyces catenulae]|uniref:Secreted protein n=1 Tax=Streptomyces catenulae TaxID=66875 RepID=A0ABV2YZF4_9ACTN|nr:hypothetical protein [Streptomyces catenulae]